MTLSKIIEQLKAADQNKTGMFELGEDVMCALVELLERRERDKQEPVGYTYNRGINFEIVAADLNADCPCGIDLYASPPEPVVPDEQHSERFEWTFKDWAEHLGGRHQNNDPACYYEFGSFLAVAEMLRQFGVVQQKVGWNACRASALNQTHVKQPASNGQSFGNSEQLEPVSQTYALRDGLAAIRKLGPIDAEKIQSERDALNSPAVLDGFRIVSLDALGAACGALQRHAPDCKTLKLLRRYTFGDLSKPSASLAAAPKQESL